MTKLAGCGGKSPRPADGGADGGLEAGPIDGSVDARPRECTGISPPCSSLPLDRCHEIRGCRPTRCRGYALACERRNEAECTGATTGCTWDPATRRCSGDPVPCPGLSEEACMEQTGCVLRATEECGGDPTPCEALSEAECDGQPGCSERGPYEACDRMDQCPAGAVCEAIDVPLQMPMRPVCRPPCMGDADCPPAWPNCGAPYCSVAVCLEDGKCAELCGLDRMGNMHECTPPYVCNLVGDMPVGICSLPIS